MNRHERLAQQAKGFGQASTTQPLCTKDPTAVEYLLVKIPLKPQEKPVTFPQHFAKTLQDEYAIKYLQRLGALPTEENIATVLRHLPLDDCQITTAWKARGSLTDVVMVDLYPQPHTGQRLSSNRQEANCAVTAMRGRQQHHEDPTPHVIDALPTTKPYQVGSVCLSFDDMKHQYLLPFKHGTRPQADVLTTYAMKHDEPAAFVPIPTHNENLHTTTPALQLFGRRATQQRVTSIKELRLPPEIKHEFILHMLHAFIAALPYASLGVRSKTERNKLSEILLHDHLVHLIEATVHYLYLAVVFKLGCLGAADLVQSAAIQAYHQNAPAEIETLYVTMVRLFNTIKLHMEQEDKGVALYLPLQLLSLRVAAQTVFRCQYPVSFSSTAPTMQSMLVAMDVQLTNVLDREQLLSRIGILETTCESSIVMATQQYHVQKRRTRLRDQFYQTSDMLHTIFPNPLPGKCRKMIKFRGGAAIGHYPLPIVPSLDSEPSNLADASAFEKVARSATLPRASLETRLELLHLIDRSSNRTKTTTDLHRPRRHEALDKDGNMTER